MSPDIVLGWLKCAGYGLGLVICGWVFLQKRQEHKADITRTAKDCRTCKYCIQIYRDGYIICGKGDKPGYDLPIKCCRYKNEDSTDTRVVVSSEIRTASDGSKVQVYKMTEESA